MEPKTSKSGSSWSLTSSSPLLKRQKNNGKTGSTSSLPTDSKAALNARDKKGRTALHTAVKKGNMHNAKKLISAGCDVNSVDNFGVTPLHEAAERYNIAMVELLIDRGGDLNAKNILGQTPLMRAVMYDDLDAVHALHKAGADIEERDCTGKTALMIGLQENRSEIVSHLLHLGCNVHLTDKLGQSPLYIIMKENKTMDKDVIRKLLKAGYDLNRDNHWLKKSEMESLQSLASESHHSGLLHKIVSKVKHQGHHKQEKQEK